MGVQIFDFAPYFPKIKDNVLRSTVKGKGPRWRPTQLNVVHYKFCNHLVYNSYFFAQTINFTALLAP